MAAVLADLANPVKAALLAGVVIDCLPVVPLVGVTLDISDRRHADNRESG